MRLVCMNSILKTYMDSVCTEYLPKTSKWHLTKNLGGKNLNGDCENYVL